MDIVKPGYNNAQSWGSLPAIKLPELLAQPPRAAETMPGEYSELWVVCVEVGTKFPAHYVHRLQSMVARHLSVPHRFCCITDKPSRYDSIGSGIWAVEPRRALPGWYSKINLFDPEIFPPGARVIYFDLDVIISGSLDPFAACGEPFIMIREFNAKPAAAHNSSVMSWLVPYAEDVYSKFADDWMERSWGDQECIWAIMGNDRVWDWPDAWVKSYKYHGRGGRVPPASVTVFHGDPKQDAVPEPWVKEAWQ